MIHIYLLYISFIYFFKSVIESVGLTNSIINLKNKCKKIISHNNNNNNNNVVPKLKIRSMSFKLKNKKKIKKKEKRKKKKKKLFEKYIYI